MEFERLNFPHQTFLPFFHRISFGGQNKELDPLELFTKLGEGKSHAFLLESCYRPSPISRYSIIGSDPFLIFRSVGTDIELIREDRRDRIKGDPMEVLKKILKTYRLNYLPSYPPFLTGGVGYFSYDLVHQFEKLPKTTTDDMKCADIYLMFVDHAVVIDHVDRFVYIVTLVGLDEDPVKNLNHQRLKITEMLEVVESCIRRKKPEEKRPAPKPSGKLSVRSNLSRDQYKQMVRRAKLYIKKGDVYQANLSQRFVAGYSQSGPHLYAALRKVNPSPFAGYMRMDGVEIVSSSPERLLKVEDNRIVTRPIAGTRPRGATQDKDKELSAELLLSPKERAEHLMLVDLERNDLGRVSRIGTVKVDQLMTVEDYSHVKHIVSNISGELDDRYEPLDALKAVFPGGTITGVPKIRCMELIDKLERYRRGPYTGSMGYLSFSGCIDLNIVIRSFVLQSGRAYFQAGGGIVADSDPDAEYEESLKKAQALKEALRIAVEGV
ncbi:MAG: anthranilate synthase component I family protein [Acidobacteriota bacterium]